MTTTRAQSWRPGGSPPAWSGRARGEGPTASAPDLGGGLDDQLQLGPLLVLAEVVALDGRREAALPGERELLERHELRRLVDPPLEVVLVLQLRALRRHQTQDNPL